MKGAILCSIFPAVHLELPQAFVIVTPLYGDACAFILSDEFKLVFGYCWVILFGLRGTRISSHGLGSPIDNH